MKLKKIVKWVGSVILGLFVLGVAVRIPYVMDAERTDELVAQIHATKLTMDDVMGTNLPPEPDSELKDATVQGIDVNQNGIRDDVELAIFAEYPNSAKTRAVLLQYALALQMETTLARVNKETATEVVREQSRAFVCIGDIVSREDSRRFDEITNSLTEFVKVRQFDTQDRKNERNNFLEKLGSYSPLNQVCDIDYSKLPN